MSNNDYGHKAAWLSDLGVNRYLKADKDMKVSNIDFLIRGAAANKAWKECNFGCHGPTYRNLTRPSTKSEFLKSLDNISPVLAGAVDGMHRQTIGQAERLGGGVKRTAEGLHIAGQENFRNIGDENIAAYQFAATAFEKILTFEIDVLDNPISQMVMTIVSEYLTALPEWLIEETLKSGALKIPDKIDIVWLLKAAALGVIENADQESIAQAVRLLNEPAQRFVGKQIGKKLASTVALAIASAITKKILKESGDLRELKERLVIMRRTARTMKGGLGGAMLTLLHAQGLLNKAAASSRKLQITCPRMWRILRFKFNGANMAYFLVENMIYEYVDRLALLEKNPKEFVRVMEILVRGKRTPEIFFPGASGY